MEAKPYSLDKAQALVVLPEGLRIPLPCPQLPELLLQSLTAIAVSASVLFSHQSVCSCHTQDVMKFLVHLASSPQHTSHQAHDSASRQEQVAVWQEERRVSRYAHDLPQLDTGRVVPSQPSQWKCEETGVTENLWLNLSTGFIGSGRQVQLS